ncbi:MAG: PEP-CTERM sorting domain-containing protein [Akkermansiaceae bacterium]|nr:PEP-CTERM sorting domain-containing protein [Akkermansiaceae bacterium]
MKLKTPLYQKWATMATFSLSVSLASATTVISGWTVIDDSYTDDASGTFAITSAGATTQTTPTQAFADTQKFSATAAVDWTATWTFLGLTNGTYEVAGAWYGTTNRTKTAPFKVQGGSTIVVNQELSPGHPSLPAGPTLSDGTENVVFSMLTATAVVTDGTLTVVLNDVDNTSGSEYVLADAIAIRAVPEPSSAALLGLGGLALILRRRKG